MIGAQQTVVKPEESFLSKQAEIEVNEVSEKTETAEEVVFIRRQFRQPTILEVRFARLKKAMRNRSAGII